MISKHWKNKRECLIKVSFKQKEWANNAIISCNSRIRYTNYYIPTESTKNPHKIYIFVYQLFHYLLTVLSRVSCYCFCQKWNSPPFIWSLTTRTKRKMLLIAQVSSILLFSSFLWILLWIFFSFVAYLSSLLYICWKLRAKNIPLKLIEISIFNEKS